LTGADDDQQLELPLGIPSLPVAGVVGFSSTRRGLTNMQLDALLSELETLCVTELHHGDCVGGDRQAHELAKSMGLRTVAHPPTSSRLRAFCDCDELRPPMSFLIRNHSIVLSTQYLIACPEGPERLRSGTWATIRFARKMRLPTTIISPDGSCEYFPEPH
jgi:hypothetical protein